MRMKRRKFIKQFPGALAAAGTLGVQSVSAITTGQTEANCQADTESLLSGINSINRTIEAEQLFDASTKFVTRQGYSNGLIREGVKQLLIAGMYRDLDIADQEHPLMQESIQNAAGLFDQTILSMATLLESMDRKKRRQIRDFLKEKPEYLQNFRAEFNRAGKRAKVPQKHLTQFNSIFDRMNTYLSRRSNWKLVDEYIEFVNEVVLKDGITADERRRMARMSYKEVSEELASINKEYHGDDFLLGAVSLQTGGDNQANPENSKRHKNRRKRIKRGLILMGIGGSAAAIGLIPFFLSEPAAPLAIVGTNGAAIFIIGLIITIVGLYTQSSEEESVKYKSNLEEAVSWVEKQREQSYISLKQLVVDAVEKFDVEFNDVWELVE